MGLHGGGRPAHVHYRLHDGHGDWKPGGEYHLSQVVTTGSVGFVVLVFKISQLGVRELRLVYDWFSLNRVIAHTDHF